jgi:DNA (cytosine-5)-methyltransferase 1
VLFSEIEKFPRRLLAMRHGAHDLRKARPCAAHVPLWGDFTALRPRHLRRFGVDLPDVIVAGTPCQAFSVAGLRRSLADARGNLTLALVRLVHAIDAARRARGERPFVLVWENVPGVLSTKDNAFGCFLGGLAGGDDPVPLPPGAERWPDAGLVAGPRARVAWRILDAQYSRLAQRRRRVFLVASFGDGIDPAAVLFERKSLRGHHPPRREAQESVAGSLTASAGGSDENDAVNERLIAFGGNNTSGQIDIAASLNACSSASGRQDFETETFIVAPPLTTNPYGDHESREGLLVTHSLRGEGFDASEDGTGRGVPIIPICFDPRQTDVLVHGDRSGALDAQFPGPAIAFSCKNYGNDAATDLTPSLRAMGHMDSRPNGGGQMAIASDVAVRRLTPRECERLQGFPDDYTLLDGTTPDGPRYKSIGLSMPVDVMEWIGARLAAEWPA